MLDWWWHSDLFLIWSWNWSTFGTWILQQIQPQRLSGFYCYLLHQHLHLILLGNCYLLNSRIHGTCKRSWNWWRCQKWSRLSISGLPRGMNLLAQWFISTCRIIILRYVTNNFYASNFVTFSVGCTSARSFWSLVDSIFPDAVLFRRRFPVLLRWIFNDWINW